VPDQIIIRDPERPTDAAADVPTEKAAREDQNIEVVSVLEGYRQEATQNRQSGLNPRDAKWRENLDLYWNRFSFAGKADWQSKEHLPEVPSFVDRFAAAMKEAVVSMPSGFYTVSHTTDKDGDLAQSIKHMNDIWLGSCGRNITGHVAGFPAVFEEQIKLGAMMAMSAVVTWKDDVDGGRVAIESVDPQSVWLDHTYRNLYRIRRSEVDKHDLVAMAKKTDSNGKQIFNLPELTQLVSAISFEDRRRAEELTGTGQERITNRQPITVDEYLATVVAGDGTVLADDALCVVANERFLIRGPERNPFWHGKDWLVYAPLITTPLSVYGRSYMEDFGSVAKTLNELTNLILDGVMVSSMKAFALVPDLLKNPAQVATGIWPMKLFELEEGVKPQDFSSVLDMGTLPPEAIRVWETLKNELREAAGINEIGLGQFAPNSRTSATEVVATQQSSSLIIRSVAQTVEQMWLNPMLDLVWKTGLQHIKPNNHTMQEALGAETFKMLVSKRRDFIKWPLTFKAEGLSKMLQRAKQLKALLQIIQIIGTNELMMKAFFGAVDIERLVSVLFELSEIDLPRLQITERQRLVRQATEPLQGLKEENARATQGRNPHQSTVDEIGSVAATLGVNANGA